MREEGMGPFSVTAGMGSGRRMVGRGPAGAPLSQMRR